VTNLLGGGERGWRVVCFAQGGNGVARRGWPERPGGGGDPGSPVSLRGRVERKGAGLGRLTDPDLSQVGVTEPGGPVGPNGPNGPRLFV
jgi:hypothetical protein